MYFLCIKKVKKILLDTILLIWRLTLKQFISENVYNLFKQHLNATKLLAIKRQWNL